MPEFTLTAESTHNRWNRDLSPQLTVGSDSVIHIECLDSSGGQVGPDSTLADFLAIDRDKIHTLTGPVDGRASSRAWDSCRNIFLSRSFLDGSWIRVLLDR